MNRKEVKAKRYSIVAIVALCAVFSSMLVMRHAAKRMTNEILQITSPTTTSAAQAENEVRDVPDPRMSLPGDETQPTLPTEAEPEKTTTRTVAQPTTQAAPPSTTEAPVTEAAVHVKNDHFVLPIENAQIVKQYSPDVLLFSETMRDWRTHSGVDFAADAGSEVRSVGNGTVCKVVSDPQRGYTIEIDYGTFTGRYCALSQDGAVGIETEVHTGDVIGTLADMPLESADAPHLHFEALQNGEPVDPMQALGLAG